MHVKDTNFEVTVTYFKQTELKEINVKITNIKVTVTAFKVAYNKKDCFAFQITSRVLSILLSKIYKSLIKLSYLCRTHYKLIPLENTIIVCNCEVFILRIK